MVGQLEGGRRIGEGEGELEGGWTGGGGKESWRGRKRYEDEAFKRCMIDLLGIVYQLVHPSAVEENN